MPRIKAPTASDASRRSVIAGLLALPACEKRKSQPAATLDMDRLDREMAQLAVRAQPGVLGIGLMDFASDQSWALNGERRFPMMSVFKAPLGAAALAEVDAGRLALTDTVEIRDIDLSPPFSPIAEAWPARTAFTWGELLTAAVGRSDNTAADVLMKRIGGPGAVTGWLAGEDIVEIRVDRYEREFPLDVLGMAPFRPAWAKAAAFDAALATIASDRRAQAFAAYLTDPRDTATPRGMLGFLHRLQNGSLLSPASTKLLLAIMEATPTGPDRLKAGLPKDARLAHKTGNGPTWQGVNSAANDVGIVTLADGRALGLAVFLTGSTLDLAGRDALIAEVARTAIRRVR